MITVKSNYDSDLQPKRISIEGHAYFGPIGGDIVCAGVSSLFYALLNLLITKGIEYAYEDTGEYVCISFDSGLATDAYEMFIIGVKGICKSFPDNVNIIFS